MKYTQSGFTFVNFIQNGLLGPEHRPSDDEASHQ